MRNLEFTKLEVTLKNWSYTKRNENYHVAPWPCLLESNSSKICIKFKETASSTGGTQGNRKQKHNQPLPSSPPQDQFGHPQIFFFGRNLCQHAEVVLLTVSAGSGSCVLTFLPIPENQRGLFLVPIKHRRQTFTSCIQTFQVWRRGRVKGCILREATQTKITQAQHS